MGESSKNICFFLHDGRVARYIGTRTAVTDGDIFTVYGDKGAIGMVPVSSTAYVTVTEIGATPGLEN